MAYAQVLTLSHPELQFLAARRQISHLLKLRLSLQEQGQTTICLNHQAVMMMDSRRSMMRGLMGTHVAEWVGSVLVRAETMQVKR